MHHGLRPIEEAKARLGTEIAWLEWIHSTTDLIVPRHVPLSDSASFGTIDVSGHPRVFVLFEWIEGEIASRSLSPDVAYGMGRAIARLHRSSQDFQYPMDLNAFRWDESEFVGGDSWILGGQAEADLGSGRYRVVKDASDRVRALMEKLGGEPAYYGLIHSDTHPGNMLTCDDGIAILDFNDCGSGHYAFDLGVMLFDLKAMCELAA